MVFLSAGIERIQANSHHGRQSPLSRTRRLKREAMTLSIKLWARVTRRCSQTA